MARVAIPTEIIDGFEDQYWLWGKKTRDIPVMACWRLEMRRHWERNATAALIFGVLAGLMSLNGHVTRWLMELCFDINAANMIVCSARAIILTRQLDRRAAEQLLRDSSGIGG
jgi:hypothetical protein